MRYLLRAILPFACIGCASPASAATPEVGARDLNDLIEPIRQARGVPALAAAVLKGGELVAIGAVSSGGTVPLDACWALGSCTKAMTATLLGVLVERGALRWDTTLAEVFPERAAAMHEAFRGVTLRQLVDHRAGLPRDRSDGGLAARLFASADPAAAQRLRILDRALARAPSAPPGSVRAYSNTGFVLAGAVVERTTGQSFEAAMHAELFLPLGMSSAAFPPSGPGSHPAWYGPAGGAWASLADWAKFVALHLDGRGRDTLALSRETLTEMHRPVGDADYACGFAVQEREWASGPVLGHYGQSATASSLVFASPADDFALLVACDEGGEVGRSACDAVASALLGIW